ncbi:MAG TPA: hypothetical protein VFX02_04750 [Gammaproteobacteria bacterium]|nr:hypothetical protein [Gammaproteobacteria bacterium]
MALNPHDNWTYAQTSLLWQLSAEKKPIHEIAAFIGKSETEILKKSSELGIVFKSEYDPLKELVEEYLNELDAEILKASGA